MEELTAGLLFNDTMVMIAGTSGTSSGSHHHHHRAGGMGRGPGVGANSCASGEEDMECATIMPAYDFDIISPSSSSSSNSSMSGDSPSGYYSNQLPPELFNTEFEFNPFELGGGGGSEHSVGSTGGAGSSDSATAAFLSGGGTSSDENLEELLSSDLSSDEDKFLETIKYGSNGGSTGLLGCTNDLLSEEELVNTIQTYGDVKVLQVDHHGDPHHHHHSGVVVDEVKVFNDATVLLGEVDHQQPHHHRIIFTSAPVTTTVATTTSPSATIVARELGSLVGVTNTMKEQQQATAGRVMVGSAKKRKGSLGAGGNAKIQQQQQNVKKVAIIQQQQGPPMSKKQPHKTQQQQRVLEEEIIIETHPSLVSADLLSPDPGSPEQQDSAMMCGTGGYQELKLSDEEKRLLSKEGITMPTHYPLTKLEERELKRIRRKIRNKISAQDSRKRKKEFLDKLQQRVQEVEDEKSSLQKRVRSLESINTKLSAQVKRLQQALASATSSATGSSSAASQLQQNNKQNVVPAATTLLVLILSLALVVLPTSLEKKSQGYDGEQTTNEIISLLNRSNELQQGSENRILTNGGGGANKSRPKSRAMVGEDEGGDDEEIDVDDKNVVELIGEMRNMLMKMGKQGNGGGSRKRGLAGVSELVGMIKRGRWSELAGGGGGGGGLAGLFGGNNNKHQFDVDDWWASDGEDEEPSNMMIGNKQEHRNMEVEPMRVASRVVGSGSGRLAAAAAAAANGNKNTFQLRTHVLDDMDVE